MISIYPEGIHASVDNRRNPTCFPQPGIEVEDTTSNRVNSALVNERFTDSGWALDNGIYMCLNKLFQNRQDCNSHRAGSSEKKNFASGKSIPSS